MALTGAGEPAVGGITDDRAKLNAQTPKLDAQSHGEGEKAPGCLHV